MAVLIDTSMLVDLERGVANEKVEARTGEQDRAISVITVSELLHGGHSSTGARRNQRSAFVEHLLTQLPAIAVTERVARVHADIWAQLEQRGELIGAHDLWIAATALAHGMAVATLNVAEFSRVNGLHVVAPPPERDARVLTHLTGDRRRARPRLRCSDRCSDGVSLAAVRAQGRLRAVQAQCDCGSIGERRAVDPRGARERAGPRGGCRPIRRRPAVQPR